MAEQRRSRLRAALIAFVAIVGAGFIGMLLDPPNERNGAAALSPEPSPSATAQPSIAQSEASPATKRYARALAGENTGPVKIGDLDEADKAIRLTINLAGHLCAKPILVQSAGSGHYGVTCILYRSGKGRANYLVQSSTGKVTAL